VDLTRQTVAVKATESDAAKKVLGGRGLGIMLLTELAPAGIDPLAPENPLILATGPYTGAGVFGLFQCHHQVAPDRIGRGESLRRQVGTDP
jgi:aldehyde:ferredoxin oxidoreductase